MTTSGDLAIVVNPRAGGGRQGERDAARLRSVAAGKGAVFVTESREMTDAVADGVRERGVSTVAIAGGDGTVAGVLTALHRAYRHNPLPRIALLRGGTMNTIANALQISQGSPEKLLARLLARPAGPVLERATLSVDGRTGFLFSAGVMVGFLDALYGSGGKGRIAALGLLARGSVETVVGGHLIEQIETPLTAALEVDGESHPARRYVALGAGTVPEVGLGFRPYPQSEERTDAFQVFAFHGSVQMLVRELPRLRRGQPATEGLGFSPVTQSLRISTEEGTVRYALDGDVEEAESPLIVRPGPAVRIAAL
ncbi:MAG: diacylglycerol kinase family protein [Myxococcales bacterium]|nr:diacylglycerol kinase family protein [Myxococcales bacterium]